MKPFKNLQEIHNMLLNYYKNLSNKKFYSLIFIIVMALNNCSKVVENVIFENYSIPTKYNLYALHILNDSICFIGGGKLYDSGFVYKSFNKGKEWKFVSSNLFGGVYGIYFKNEQTGIGTTWNTNFYITNDSAKNFSKVSAELDNIVTSPIMVDDQLFVAVSHNGFLGGYFWKSTNGGKNWDTLNFQRACTKIIKSYNDYFISCSGMVFYSNDALKIWQPKIVKGDVWLDIDFPSYNTGFLTGFEGNILKTTNRGQTWKSMRTGNYLLHKGYNFTQASFINEHIGVVGTYEGDILFTSDGGYSWQVIKGFNNKTIRDIHLYTEHSGIAIGDEGTVFKFILP